MDAEYRPHYVAGRFRDHARLARIDRFGEFLRGSLQPVDLRFVEQLFLEAETLPGEFVQLLAVERPFGRSPDDRIRPLGRFPLGALSRGIKVFGGRRGAGGVC